MTHSLSGTLARSFTAVERWLKDDAVGDTRMQKAHKLLARIHEQCTLITDAIGEIGLLNRQINHINNEAMFTNFPSGSTVAIQLHFRQKSKLKRPSMHKSTSSSQI